MPVAWLLLFVVLDLIMQIHCYVIGGNEENIIFKVDRPQIPTQISVFPAISYSALAAIDKWVPVTEGQTVLLKCTEDYGQHSKKWQTPSFRVFHSANKSYESRQQFKKNGHPRIEALQSGHLLIKDFRRNDAGRYRCTSGSIRRVINLGINDAVFRKLYTHSLYIGFTTAGLFLALVLVMQSFCYLMNRFGYKCCWGTYISPKAKKVGRLIKTIEQYKTQQLDRLNQNYNSQVSNIKESCFRQMDHLQESYTSQMKLLKNLSQYSNQQLHQIRDQYNEQRSRVGEYSIRQLNKVHNNYMEQQDRVCRYTTRQLQYITETYKYQQKTFNKMMENIPDFNINSCLYMDPKTIEMKNRSKCTRVIIDRDAMIPIQENSYSKSADNGMGTPDMNDNSGILDNSSLTLRLPQIPNSNLLENENNTSKLKNNCNKVNCIPRECTVKLNSNSLGQQADVQFASVSSNFSESENILPGLTKEDKYNVGDKDGKKEISVMQLHKMIIFGHLS